MRPSIRLIVFCTFTALFSLSASTYSVGQEIRQLWYLSDKPLAKPLPGIVYAPPADLIQKRFEIMGTASGLVIQYVAFEKYGSQQIQALKNAVDEERKFVFAVGDDVPANYVQNKLKIVRKVGLLEKRISKWRIVADGLYRDPSGLINGINIMALKETSPEFILEEVRDAIIRSTKRQVPQKSEWWEQRPSQRQIFPDPPYGKYEQVVTPHILRGKPAPEDYWYTRLENTAIPGQVVYKKSGFGNRFNTSTYDVSSSLSLLCHGPTGVVNQNQSAKVSIGCPGPNVEWQWNTGATTVVDKSNVKGRQGQWDVDYDPNEEESKKEHQWLPGLEVRNGKNQQFVMGIKSVVHWVDRKGNIEKCQYEWSHPFTADP